MFDLFLCIWICRDKCVNCQYTSILSIYHSNKTYSFHFVIIEETCRKELKIIFIEFSTFFYYLVFFIKFSTFFSYSVFHSLISQVFLEPQLFKQLLIIYFLVKKLFVYKLSSCCDCIFKYVLSMNSQLLKLFNRFCYILICQLK